MQYKKITPADIEKIKAMRDAASVEIDAIDEQLIKLQARRRHLLRQITNRNIGDMFGVAPQTVSRCVNGRVAYSNSSS